MAGTLNDFEWYYYTNLLVRLRSSGTNMKIGTLHLPCSTKVMLLGSGELGKEEITVNRYVTAGDI